MKKAVRRKVQLRKEKERKQKRELARSGGARVSNGSRPIPHPAWQWREAQAGDLSALEGSDPYAALRNAVRAASAASTEFWAGVPMPLDGERLIIEPKYPRGEHLSELTGPEEDADAMSSKGISKVRNTFWSRKLRSEIVVFEKVGGAIGYGAVPGIHHLDHDLRTMGCSVAWGIEQEHNALKTLGTMLRHQAFKYYLMTGTFLETSPRSGITYFFRKLRPTVAIAIGRKRDDLKILCTLCLHPIGYYAGSWAGAMCPTDDVIAHLALMRGDEPMFWRRANQTPAYRPEAGL